MFIVLLYYYYYYYYFGLVCNISERLVNHLRTWAVTNTINKVKVGSLQCNHSNHSNATIIHPHLIRLILDAITNNTVRLND